MAIIRTMKGGKSNFHMRASSMNPNCNGGKEQTQIRIKCEGKNRITKVAIFLTRGYRREQCVKDLQK